MRRGRAVAAVPVLLVHVHVEVEPRVGGVLAVGARHRVHLVQVHGPVVVLQVGRAAPLLWRGYTSLTSNYYDFPQKLPSYTEIGLNIFPRLIELPPAPRGESRNLGKAF